MIVGPFGENCFILSKEDKSSILIDPGDEAEEIINFIKRKKLKPVAIFCTHAHIDHVGGVKEMKEYFNIPFYIHKEDLALLKSIKAQAESVGLECGPVPDVDMFLKDSETVTAGGFEVKVLHTPGHTPGGVCLKIDKKLFTGDTLFAGSIGRSDLPGGSYNQLIESIENKILPLEDDIEVFPGHGKRTTIGQERHANPFLIDPDRYR